MFHVLCALHVKTRNSMKLVMLQLQCLRCSLIEDERFARGFALLVAFTCLNNEMLLLIV